MRVGSLHNPREYDGRLPPDVDYYLDLVIPRFEEPQKKICSRVKINYMEEHRNRVIKLHANQSQTISKFTSKTNQKNP